VLKEKKNMHAHVQWINKSHMGKDREFFGEALDMVEQLDIEKIITFSFNFDPKIMA
jgi:hypothetical protein